MSNELQVKTVTLTPAKVEFNFDELSEVLDQQLEKYEGLNFTEKEVAACKKTIAELNKGKKALNDYRLATKKELTVSVTDFEKKCKELSAKFDQVINPLKEQADEFEENRKEEKRKKIQYIIDELLDKEGLNEKYSAQLVIDDKYLNKSTSMKSIEEELTTKAEHLGIQQDKEESDIEIIKMSVDMANQHYGVSLLDSSYIRLLDHEDMEEIKKSITADAKREVERRKEKVVFAEKVEPEETYIEQSKNDEQFIESYKVTGTESQLDALEKFMTDNLINWSVI